MTVETSGDGTAIVVSGLTKRYASSRSRAGAPVLDGINLDVPCGQSLGVIGPNGAGKTTLLLLLLGFLQPDKGEVRLFASTPQASRSKGEVGYLPETFVPPGGLTGYQYLLSMSRLYGHDRVSAARAVERAAGACSFAVDLNAPLRHCSKGALRQVGIIRAFLDQPRLLLLDEPTASLDPPSVIALRNKLRRSNETSATLVVVSHHLSEVQEVCDRVVLLDRGSILVDRDLSTGIDGDLFALFGCQGGFG